MNFGETSLYLSPALNKYITILIMTDQRSADTRSHCLFTGTIKNGWYCNNVRWRWISDNDARGGSGKRRQQWILFAAVSSAGMAPYVKECTVPLPRPRVLRTPRYIQRGTRTYVTGKCGVVHVSNLSCRVGDARLGGGAEHPGAIEHATLLSLSW